MYLKNYFWKRHLRLKHVAMVEKKITFYSPESKGGLISTKTFQFGSTLKKIAIPKAWDRDFVHFFKDDPS